MRQSVSASMRTCPPPAPPLWRVGTLGEALEAVAWRDAAHGRRRNRARSKCGETKAQQRTQKAWAMTHLTQDKTSAAREHVLCKISVGRPLAMPCIRPSWQFAGRRIFRRRDAHLTPLWVSESRPILTPSLDLGEARLGHDDGGGSTLLLHAIAARTPYGSGIRSNACRGFFFFWWRAS